MLLVNIVNAYDTIYSAGYDLSRSKIQPNLTVSKEVADLLVDKDYPQHCWTNGTDFTIVGSNLVVTQYSMGDDYETGELTSYGVNWEIIIPII